jgi:hypothetical protein
MATPTQNPNPTTDHDDEVNRRPVAVIAAFAFGLGPLAGGAVAYSRIVPADPKWEQVEPGLNAVGATLVLIAAVALMANMAVRFRQPKARAVPVLDATVVSLGGWGAVFLAVAVLDADHIVGVLIASAVGALLVIGSLATTTDRW